MKHIARWAVYVPLFVIPFLPLYVANDLFFPFITGKGFAFRILVEVAFGGWIILALAAKEYRPRFSWTLVFYGAFVLWMLIADLVGANPHKALWSNFERMEGWITLIHVFLFFLVSGAVLTTDVLWRKWWLTFLSASAILSAYCVIQLMGGAPIHQGGVRVDGTFGNAAYLASYLLFAVAISLWQGLASRGWLRYSLFALAAVEIIIIFFTATRGAIIGLVAAGVVGGLLWAFESGRGGRKIALGVVLGILVLSGGVYLLRGTAFVQGDPTLARITSIGPSDLTVRATLWSMAFEGIAERPILGWGQEGFNFIFYEHYRPSLYAQEPWFDRAHNAFIDWLVAGGIPGLLLFLAAFGLAVLALYRGQAPREERVLLIAALTAYAVQGMVVFDHLFTYVPLAAILATAHAASARPWKQIEAAKPLTEENLQLAAPVVAVVTLLVVWFVNVPNIAAASELVQAITIRGSDVTKNVQLFQQALNEPTFGRQEIREQLMSFTNNIAAAQGHSSAGLTQLQNYTLSEMRKEVDLLPTDARIRLQYALGLRVAGQYDRAIAEMIKAHELSPTKQSILIEEGLTYWQMNEFEKARDAFETAYELDTSFDQLAEYAAAGNIITGNPAAGKALLTDRFGTTTLDSEPLILAYYQVRDFPDLIGSLQKQVENQHGSVESHLRLASGYVAAGNIAAARAEAARATTEHPEAAAQVSEFLTHVK